jgi:hypothetical protein
MPQTTTAGGPDIVPHQTAVKIPTVIIFSGVLPDSPGILETGGVFLPIWGSINQGIFSVTINIKTPKPAASLPVRK